MRPKLLVGLPEGKTSTQMQNLSKDNQLLEAKRTHSSRHLEAVAQMYHGQVDDHNNFLHEHSQGTESSKASFNSRDSLAFSEERRFSLDPQRFVCHRVDRDGVPLRER